MGVNRNHWSAKPYWSLLSGRVRGFCYYGARYLWTKVMGGSLFSAGLGWIAKRIERKNKNRSGRVTLCVEVEQYSSGNDKVRKRCGCKRNYLSRHQRAAT